LHINTDYPIFAKPCYPQLALALGSALANTLREVLSTGALFGLTASASTRANALFLPTSETFQGAFVYQNLHAAESLYRCQPDDPSTELWALSSGIDRDAWRRCEGRLWIDVEAAHVRTSLADRSAVGSGLYVDTGVRRCEQFLSNGMRESVVVVTADEGGTETILFAQGASPLDVSCTLLWKLGHFMPPTARKLRTRFRLPARVGPIELFADLVVHGGQFVSLETSDDELSTSEATVLLGRWQVQVNRDGALDLERVKLVNATGASALFSEGAVNIVNCTFSRCHAQATFGPPSLTPAHTPTLKHTHTD
jgi:hypothetical protein